MSSYVFQVSQLPVLDLKIACPVSISPSDFNSVEVDVLGDEADKVIVNQSGNKVIVDCKNVPSSSGNSIIINDGNRSVFMSGSSNISIGSIGGSRGGVNISGVSGKVIINGQEIDLSQNSDGTKKEPLAIKIKAPLCSLILDSKGHTEFDASTAKIQDAFVSLAGLGNAVLKAQSLDAQVSGSGDVRHYGVVNGHVKKSVSGSGTVKV